MPIPLLIYKLKTTVFPPERNVPRIVSAKAVTREAKPYTRTMKSAIMPNGLRANPLAASPNDLVGSNVDRLHIFSNIRSHSLLICGIRCALAALRRCEVVKA